jgi:hypothetical protein
MTGQNLLEVIGPNQRGDQNKTSFGSFCRYRAGVWANYEDMDPWICCSFFADFDSELMIQFIYLQTSGPWLHDCHDFIRDRDNVTYFLFKSSMVWAVIKISLTYVQFYEDFYE